MENKTIETNMQTKNVKSSKPELIGFILEISRGVFETCNLPTGYKVHINGGLGFSLPTLLPGNRKSSSSTRKPNHFFQTYSCLSQKSSG